MSNCKPNPSKSNELQCHINHKINQLLAQLTTKEFRSCLVKQLLKIAAQIGHISLRNANTTKINEAEGFIVRPNKRFDYVSCHFLLSPDSTSFHMAEILFIYKFT